MYYNEQSIDYHMSNHWYNQDDQILITILTILEWSEKEPTCTCFGHDFYVGKKCIILNFFCWITVTQTPYSVTACWFIIMSFVISTIFTLLKIIYSLNDPPVVKLLQFCEAIRSSFPHHFTTEFDKRTRNLSVTVLD